MIALPLSETPDILDTVICGDCLEVLREMESNSVDAIVTDPPAGIAFMGKEWDSPDTFNPERIKQQMEKSPQKSLGPHSEQYDGYVRKQPRTRSAFSGPANHAGNYDLSRKGRDAFITMMRDIFTEALRVLRPGGHALVWALPRTSHWTATALEDAGFEVRDCLTHLFGSGFPKSMDISKAIDKMAGAEREVIGTKYAGIGRHGRNDFDVFHGTIDESLKQVDITVPATPEAARYAGYGSALKPASEHWWLVRKPLSESSIAANVLKWGTGGLAIDATRVNSPGPHGSDGRTTYDAYERHTESHLQALLAVRTPRNPQGRFPANLLLSHSLWCVPTGSRKVKTETPHNRAGTLARDKHKGWGMGNDIQGVGYADPDGYEQVEAWDCAPDCPVAELDRQSGIRKSGARPAQRNISYFGNGHGTNDGERITYEPSTASRYFQTFPADFVPFRYQAKASRAERNAGCEGLPSHDRAELTGRKPGSPGLVGSNGDGNNPFNGANYQTPIQNSHPTVKPLQLMSWLIRLITPPGGIVLDPFLGSGSTAVAAIHEGVHFVGIEQDASYVAIAEARIAHAYKEARWR